MSTTAVVQRVPTRRIARLAERPQSVVIQAALADVRALTRELSISTSANDNLPVLTSKPSVPAERPRRIRRPIWAID